MYDNDRPNTTVGEFSFLSLCHFLILLESCFIVWLHSPTNFQIIFLCYEIPTETPWTSFFRLFHHMGDAQFCLPKHLLILWSPPLDPLFSCRPQITQHNTHRYACRHLTLAVLARSGCTYRREIILLVFTLYPTFSLWLSTSACCGNNSYQNGKLTRAQNLFSCLAQELPNAYSSFSNHHKPVLP